MHGFGPAQLLACYARGVFPMADSHDDPRIFLLDPDTRGVLPLESFHVPRRLRRTVRADLFEVRIDTAFAQTVAACAGVGPVRRDTWINPRIERLYVELAAYGHAHSVECWRDGALVGGLYGVRLGAAFFGESMFARARDASKVALVHLVGRLLAGGFRLLDAQFITEHLKQFGAREIARVEYHRALAAASPGEADWDQLPAGASGADVLSIIDAAAAAMASVEDGPASSARINASH